MREANGTFLFTVREVAHATGGAVVSPGSPDSGCARVVIDSRAVRPGDLFVALKGERADGHDHLAEASAKGASACLVAEAAWKERASGLLAQSLSAAFVAVPDTLRALQDLAAAHVAKFPRLLKIGITGSSGKTTTKEMIGAVFSRERATVMNEGNLNSDSGLPLSVFAIGARHEVGVFEMGMNRKGEMAELARVLKPNAVAITNIGTAHIGILGTRDAIALEKKSAFGEFSGDGVAFVPEADDYRDFLSEGVRGTVVEYGPAATEGFEGSRDLALDGTEILWKGLSIRLPLPGAHNLSNALAAISVATRFGVSPESVKAGLESVRALPGRSEVIRGKYLVLKDCYNANPDSAAAAIGFCDEAKLPGRRLYVLGSMFELGAESAEAHRSLGALAARSRADAVFFFGSETAPAHDEAVRLGFPGRLARADDIGALAELCLSWLREGDFILLKASRGMALERLLPLLGIPGTDATDGRS